MKPLISGIQQIGIGVSNVHEAWTWYRQHFFMDVPVFEEAATAALMLPYTGGEPRDRHAILALNTQGGGGFEIWQYTSRTPEAADFDIQLGDLGLFLAKMKTRNVQATYKRLQSKGAKIIGELSKRPNGEEHFFVEDPYGNIFEVVPATDFFKKDKHHIGGPYGMMIGVSDMERSIAFYKNILGYDTIVYDKTGTFEDLKPLNGGAAPCRRVLLTHGQPRQGAFSQMLGASEMELIQLEGGAPKNIFKNRFWGDLGFIHLCFDIVGMDELRAKCEKNGHPFTVDSKASLADKFDMGEAAGHFSYIEDPDGTLIEFVETLKVPIMKKLNWYLDIKKRPEGKPLPKWMLRAMALNRKKEKF